jgi:hypothetical protein
MKWTRALLTHPSVNACQEGLAWTHANGLWGEQYETVKAVLQSQIDAGVISTGDPVEDAEGWLRWGEKLVRKAAALRATSNRVEERWFVAYAGRRHEVASQAQAEQMAATINARPAYQLVEAARVHLTGKGHRFERVTAREHIVEDGQYVVTNPKTRRRVRTNGVAETEAAIARAAQWLSAKYQARVWCVVEDDEGHKALEAH